jgi:hypothetical protein
MLRIGAVIGFALVAAASAFGASATPASVLDRTYSCRVRQEHYVDVNTSVTLPPEQGYPRPAQLWLDTVHKTQLVGGLHAVVAQVRFEAVKNSLSIDTSLSRHSSHAVALEPAGLPLYETATPDHLGKIDARCGTAKRVLVRFRIELTAGKPLHALFAVRNDTSKSKPVEFVKWSPAKITGYLGKSCTDTS